MVTCPLCKVELLQTTKPFDVFIGMNWVAQPVVDVLKCPKCGNEHVKLPVTVGQCVIVIEVKEEGNGNTQ